MPDCGRCAKRVGDRNLTTATLTYGVDDYRFCLCPGCFRDWDLGIWEWLSVADEEPLYDPELGCYYCGQHPVEDGIEVGYSKRTWYFAVCAADSKRWSTFLWSWLKFAETIPRPFEWQARPRLAATSTTMKTQSGRPVRAVEECEDGEFRLANHVALQLRDLQLTWQDVLQVLNRPVAVADTDSEGVARYMTPTLTVFLDEAQRSVVGVRRERGYRTETFSDEARSYRFSLHARFRMTQRSITANDVFRALDDRRKAVAPDRTKPGCQVILTDELKMAINPTTKEIITVCWRGCEARAAS